MIVKGKPKYDGVLNIPEGESGEYAIKHKLMPAGSVFVTATLRMAMHAGHKAQNIRYDHDTRWHSLVQGENVWMTDSPLEQVQHDRLMQGFRGRVLVGGLGLGYTVTMLSAKRQVKEIVVIERSPDVANLVWPHVRTHKAQLVIDDLHRYTQRTDIYFENAFYDIWQLDNAYTFHYTVLPLRVNSEGKVGRLECWHEDVMRGQLFQALIDRLGMLQLKEAGQGLVMDEYPSLDDLADCAMRGVPAPTNVWLRWSAPYWRWYRRVYPTLDVASEIAALYARYYGITNDQLSILLGEDVESYLPKEDANV